MHPKRDPPRRLSHESNRIPRREFVHVGLSVAATTALWACGSKPTDLDFGNSRLTARPGPPTVTPTLGQTELGIGSGRDGLLYIPANYSAETPAPLFIALHGAGGDADNWGNYPDRAEQRGMIFLAVDSRGFTWDLVGGGFGIDVRFLDVALRHTFDRVNVDPTHIALGGFSDGASYALSLGMANGDLFSHLVAFSPGFVNTNPLIGKPPIYVSHGTSDGVLPVQASRDNIVPTLRDIGYDVTYNEFPGDHGVPAEVSESALDWFLA